MQLGPYNSNYTVVLLSEFMSWITTQITTIYFLPNNVR